MKKILLVIIILFNFNFLLYSQIDYSIHLKDAPLTGIAFEGNTVWVSSYGKGIYKLDLNKDNNKWTNFNSKQKNFENDFFYCIAANKDYVWAGTGDGLYTYDKKKNQWKKRKFALGGELGNWIRSLYYDEKTNTLWIGRFKNLTRLNVKSQKFEDFDLTQSNESKSNTIKVIRNEDEQYLWFGTESGAFRYDRTKSLKDKGSLLYINNENNGFRAEGDFVSVSDILFDKDYIWFGTDEFITNDNPDFNIGGIYKFDRRVNWYKIDKRNGLPANGVYSLSKTGNKIWASLYEFNKKNKEEIPKGLYLIDRVTNEVTKINPDDIKLTTNAISFLVFDNEDMWIGTDKGLWKVKITNPFAQWTLKKKSVSK